MKSEAYQKEGWSVLEDFKKAFGEGAEALEKDISLESEGFDFYRKNKEEANNNIEKTVADIDAFMETLLADIPDLTEDEVEAGVKKLLDRTHPSQAVSEAETEIKAVRSKKATIRVLFIAAVLTLLLVSGLFVMGTRHNISIENGFASFAKNTVQVVFFGEDEKYISVDSLLADLEAHGFTDIVFPQEFVTNSDEYKVSVPEYKDAELRYVSFEIYHGDITYSLLIYKSGTRQETYEYADIYDGDTVVVGDMPVYVIEFDNDDSAIECIKDNYRYYIKANISCSEIVKMAETIK